MKNGKLKIAFIHPDLGIGGAERLVLDVAAALANHDHQVRFITNHFDKNHAFDELKSGKYPVEVYGDWIPRSLCGKFQALCAYVRMVYLTVIYLLFGRNDDKPDLYFTDLIPIANPFLKMAQEKVIYYCHHPDLLASTPGGFFKKLYRKPLDWLEMKATGQADLILVNSKYTAEIFKQTFPQIVKVVHILYPTVAYSFQKSVDQLKNVKPIEDIVPEINFKGDKCVFLSLNRFHPAKKLDLAVLAMDKLKNCLNKNEWEKVYLIIAGGYDPQSVINAKTFTSLSNLVKEKQLENKVILLKSPSDAKKVELLSTCSCLIYTPVKEHFGIVPLEAMTVSKPVIAVDSGGPRETVKHGVTGFLCEPTGESMAEFMCKIVREDVKEMGIKGRKRLDELFSYQMFKNNLRKIVVDVMKNEKKNK